MAFSLDEHKQKIQAIVDRFTTLKNPNINKLAAALGIPSRTVWDAIYIYAPRYGIPVAQKSVSPLPELPEPSDELQVKIKMLTAQLASYKNNELSARYIRTKILGLAEQPPAPPSWLVETKPSKSSPGVPTLFASDWHHGEVIEPSQVGGINQYNLNIAHDRQKQLITRTIDLLDSHMVNPSYPGIVFALGGDMVSGDIHDELKETNDIPLIPAVLDLLNILTWCITTLADRFGRVFVPCVTGNHGRNTLKIRAKDRHYTSFDWLTYQLLEKHFKSDPRVSFLIPDGPDAYYRVFGHRYLLTHGDAFRAGDSMIGPLGPIIRGDHKKRGRNNQIDMPYDTLMLGHFHQLVQMQRLIVNGSLCGYNEYAYAGNFPFERPRQGLWLTHPQHGITISMPVNVSDIEEKKGERPWVSTKGI